MKAKFHTDVKKIHSQPFVIEDIVELSKGEYDTFCNDPTYDYPFLQRFKNKTYTDDDNISRCGLVLCKGEDDGVLVMTYDHDYARYTSPLPSARQIAILQMYPSLKHHIGEMDKIVQSYAGQAVDTQNCCQSAIKYADIQDRVFQKTFNMNLFEYMLYDRPEVAWCEPRDDDKLFAVCIADKYVKKAPLLRELTQGNVELMCAKHILWLNDVDGGEQADFSNCLLQGIDLSNKKLSEAVFNGTSFINVKLNDCDLSSSSFDNAKFYNCEMINTDANSGLFKETVFNECKLHYIDFNYSNFTRARFVFSDVSEVRMFDCCAEDTSFGNAYNGIISDEDMSYKESEWLSDGEKNDVGMGEIQ